MKSQGSLRERVCIVLLLSGLSCAPASEERAYEQFNSRVEEYVRLHRDLESKLPALPEVASPEQIVAHQQALAQAIRAARPRARRGDIFSAAERYLRRAIAAELESRETARESIKDGNPHYEAASEPWLPAVNADYPPQAPVSTVPPAVLLRLPSLPDELNYRFVGPHLILHDTHADLIVDFVLNVAP